jgi:hypothetical protein
MMMRQKEVICSTDMQVGGAVTLGLSLLSELIYFVLYQIGCEVVSVTKFVTETKTYR